VFEPESNGNMYHYDISDQPELYDIESSTRKEVWTAAGNNRFKGIGATQPPQIPQTSHKSKWNAVKPLSLENTEKLDSKHFKITFNDPNAKIILTNTNQSSWDYVKNTQNYMSSTMKSTGGIPF